MQFTDLYIVPIKNKPNPMDQKILAEFPISVGSYTSFVDKIIALGKGHTSSFICIANVHMFIEAYKDEAFGEIIKRATVVTPDGVPLTWGLSIFYGIKQVRVAGMDLLPDIMHNVIKNKQSVFFYGGTPILLNRTRVYLKKYFPILKQAGFYSPPFRELTNAENKAIINRINSSGANIVFVILGCPKQEKWMASMKGKINGCMIGIGGALPVLIGLQKRAPVWMQGVGMEWLYRLYLEPKRLYKRYAITNTMFFYVFFKEYIKVKFTGNFKISKR